MNEDTLGYNNIKTDIRVAIYDAVEDLERRVEALEAEVARLREEKA